MFFRSNLCTWVGSGQWAAASGRPAVRTRPFWQRGWRQKGITRRGEQASGHGMGLWSVYGWDGWTEGGVDELPCCAQPACLLCVRAVELCFPAAVLLLCSVGVVVDLRYGNCAKEGRGVVCTIDPTNDTVRAWVGDRNATLLAMRLRLPARRTATLCLPHPLPKRTPEPTHHCRCRCRCERDDGHRPARLARRGRGHT